MKKETGGRDPYRAEETGGGVMGEFEDALRSILNMTCQENISNTPDFILAQYMLSCLSAFNAATQQREAWYERDPKKLPPCAALRAENERLREVVEAAKEIDEGIRGDYMDAVDPTVLKTWIRHDRISALRTALKKLEEG